MFRNVKAAFALRDPGCRFSLFPRASRRWRWHRAEPNRPLRAGAASKIQEEAGKVVGSTEQQAKGVANQVAGKPQGKIGDLKEAVRDATN